MAETNNGKDNCCHGDEDERSSWQGYAMAKVVVTMVIVNKRQIGGKDKCYQGDLLRM